VEVLHLPDLVARWCVGGGLVVVVIMEASRSARLGCYCKRTAVD
jgi:hypothetical protein